MAGISKGIVESIGNKESMLDLEDSSGLNGKGLPARPGFGLPDEGSSLQERTVGSFIPNRMLLRVEEALMQEKFELFLEGSTHGEVPHIVIFIIFWVKIHTKDDT